MRGVFNATVLSLSLILSSPAFSQSTSATVSGQLEMPQAPCCRALKSPRRMTPRESLPSC